MRGTDAHQFLLCERLLATLPPPSAKWRVLLPPTPHGGRRHHAILHGRLRFHTESRWAEFRCSGTRQQEKRTARKRITLENGLVEKLPEQRAISCGATLAHDSTTSSLHAGQSNFKINPKRVPLFPVCRTRCASLPRCKVICWWSTIEEIPLFQPFIVERLRYFRKTGAGNGNS